MIHELYLTLLALATIHLIAVASPGPDFALIVKNSIGKGRKAGLASSAGIALAAGLHVIFVLTGISLLVTKFPPLFYAIQYGGAAYLIYIGIKSLGAKACKIETNKISDQTQSKQIKYLPYFVQGFVTNALNPKAWIYFTAIFSQFINLETPPQVLFFYWIIIMFIQIGWFSGMAFFLTHPVIRKRFMTISHWIERICGGLLVALGLKLALSKI